MNHPIKFFGFLILLSLLAAPGDRGALAQSIGDQSAVRNSRQQISPTQKPDERFAKLGLSQDPAKLKKWQKRRKELATESKKKFGVWRQWTIQGEQYNAAMVDSNGTRVVLVVGDNRRKAKGWLAVPIERLIGREQTRVKDFRMFEKLSKSEKKKFLNNEYLIDTPDEKLDPYLALLDNAQCLTVDYHQKQDVLEIFGRAPDSQHTTGDFERWTWSAQGPDYSRAISLKVIFKDGKVRRIEKSWD